MEEEQEEEEQEEEEGLKVAEKEVSRVLKSMESGYNGGKQKAGLLLRFAV